MALVIKLANANFANNLGAISPPTNGLLSMFEFGVNAQSSSINEAGDLSGGFFGSGFTYDSNSVYFPTGSADNWFRDNNVELESETMVFFVKSGQFPRLMKTAASNGLSLLIEGGGVRFKVNTGTATETEIFESIPSVQGSFILIASVSGGSSSTDISVRIVDSVGNDITFTASGGARDYTESAALHDINRIQNNNIWSLSEYLLYNRAVGGTDSDLIIDYMKKKYF